MMSFIYFRALRDLLIVMQKSSEPLDSLPSANISVQRISEILLGLLQDVRGTSALDYSYQRVLWKSMGAQSELKTTKMVRVRHLALHCRLLKIFNDITFKLKP